MSTVATTMPTAAARTVHPEHLRLTPCRRCSARARTLVEVDGVLAARCLRCGSAFDTALATERRRPVAVVGRGGQAVEVAGMRLPPVLQGRRTA